MSDFKYVKDIEGSKFYRDSAFVAIHWERVGRKYMKMHILYATGVIAFSTDKVSSFHEGMGQIHGFLRQRTSKSYTFKINDDHETQPLAYMILWEE